MVLKLNDSYNSSHKRVKERHYKEALSVGNSVSNELPAYLDNFLQDMAQMYADITYTDIMDHEYTPQDIKTLKSLYKEFSQLDDNTEHSDRDLNHIIDQVEGIFY